MTARAALEWLDAIVAELQCHHGFMTHAILVLLFSLQGAAHLLPPAGGELLKPSTSDCQVWRQLSVRAAACTDLFRGRPLLSGLALALPAQLQGCSCCV